MNEPRAPGRPGRPSRKGSPVLAFAVGCVLALVGGYALLSLDETGVAVPGSGVAEGGVGTPGTLDTPLAPNEILALTRDELPASGPLRLTVGLPAPPPDAGPRPVHVVCSGDGRSLDTEAELSEARDTASLEIDPEFLQPGTYLVEVQTGEPEHEGPRRYVLLIR